MADYTRIGPRLNRHHRFNDHPTARLLLRKNRPDQARLQHIAQQIRLFAVDDQLQRLAQKRINRLLLDRLQRQNPLLARLMGVAEPQVGHVVGRELLPRPSD